jgi:hypothetical protein
MSIKLYSLDLSYWKLKKSSNKNIWYKTRRFKRDRYYKK